MYLFLTPILKRVLFEYAGHELLPNLEIVSVDYMRNLNRPHVRIFNYQDLFILPIFSN
jgi:hypothetical protein